MDGFGLLCFSFIQLFCLEINALPCTNIAGLYQHGKMFNNGRVLKRVNVTGPHECIRTCQKTGGCTHINYHRCEFECDLMTWDCISTELDLTEAVCMASATLPNDTQVCVPTGNVLNQASINFGSF